MKLKGLLHLYNDGHEPFGRGGLGYHPIRMLGDGFFIDEDHKKIFFDNDDSHKSIQLKVKGQDRRVKYNMGDADYGLVKAMYNEYLDSKKDPYTLLPLFDSYLEDVPATIIVPLTTVDMEQYPSHAQSQPIIELKDGNKVLIDKNGDVYDGATHTADHIVIGPDKKPVIGEDGKNVYEKLFYDDHIDTTKDLSEYIKLAKEYIFNSKSKSLNGKVFESDGLPSDSYDATTLGRKDIDERFNDKRDAIKVIKAFLRADLRFISTLLLKYKDKKDIDDKKNELISLSDKFINILNKLNYSGNDTYIKEVLSDKTIRIKTSSNAVIQPRTTEAPYPKTEVYNAGVNYDIDIPVQNFNNQILTDLYTTSIKVKGKELSYAKKFERVMCDHSVDVYGTPLKDSEAFIQQMYDSKIKPTLIKLSEELKKIKKLTPEDIQNIRTKYNIPDTITIPKKLTPPNDIKSASYCHDAVPVTPVPEVKVIAEFKFYDNIDFEYLIQKNIELKELYKEELREQNPNHPLLSDTKAFDISFYQNRPYYGIPLTLNKLNKQNPDNEFLKINTSDSRFVMANKFKARHVISRIIHGAYEPFFTLKNQFTKSEANYITDINKQIIPYLINKELKSHFSGESKKPKGYDFILTTKCKNSIVSYNYSDDEYISDPAHIFNVYQASHKYDSYTNYSDADFEAVLIPAERFYYEESQTQTPIPKPKAPNTKEPKTSKPKSTKKKNEERIEI